MFPPLIKFDVPSTRILPFKHASTKFRISFFL